MNRTINMLASAGLAIGFLFGMTANIFAGDVSKIVMYEISSVGLTAACVLLGVKFIREQKDLLASGFLLFAIGEGVMSGGTALGEVAGQASFAAGLALYVPALLLISLPKGFPLWTRITGIAASVPFLIAASIIFTGGKVSSSDVLPAVAYALLTVTIIGWIIRLIREGKA